MAHSPDDPMPCHARTRYNGGLGAASRPTVTGPEGDEPRARHVRRAPGDLADTSGRPEVIRIARSQDAGVERGELRDAPHERPPRARLRARGGLALP